ncbi:heavy-metal-associated domain-containing protein [Propionivibrio sp.]|uniref:heavy-metal-associated domain-containing protein n=1 Tax=Propionivibrio sp. TaxID=2212460 RepID=UPI00272E8415|nr:heavy-metal-associated domain-containing protein [Propionivibrio sp.]
METTLIKIGGMSCGGCVKSITGVLVALPGVVRADVSLEPAQAVVEFDPARVARVALVEAINEAGFDAA